MGTTEHVPGSDLTIRQKAAAAQVLLARPHCHPGTDTIINTQEAARFHRLVGMKALAMNIRPEQTEAFCDACGVGR